MHFTVEKSGLSKKNFLNTFKKKDSYSEHKIFPSKTFKKSNRSQMFEQ